MKYHNHGFGAIAAGLITLCIMLVLAGCSIETQSNSVPASDASSKATDTFNTA